MVKTVLFVTIKGINISAYRTRMNYFKRALSKEGYNLLEFNINLSGFRKYLHYFFRFLPKNLLEMSKRADLIITSTPSALSAIIGYKAARKQYLPLIIDVRDLWEEYAKTGRSLMYKIGIIQRIVKEYYEALRYSSVITVVTEPIKQYYEEKIGAKDKLIVISNGTDTDLIKPDKELRREVDLVYLADLNQPYHNLEFLFQALRDEKLTLIVVGGGKYLSKLKSDADDLGIGDRVLFVGWVPYENLSYYLCRAKVGVVGRPFITNIAYTYTIPVKVYDYLAAGLPIVGYGPKNSFLEEFIRENNVGAYVDNPNPKILRDELIKLVAEHEKYVEKARELAIKFNRKNLSRKFVEVVNNLLG